MPAKWRVMQKEVELPDDWRPFVALSADEQLDVLQLHSSCRLPPMSQRDKWLAPLLETYMDSATTSSMAVILPGNTDDPYAGKRETIHIPHKDGEIDRGIRPERRR